MFSSIGVPELLLFFLIILIPLILITLTIMSFRKLGRKSKRRRQTMSYIDNNLMTGETVIYRAKLHWIVFAWPIVWLIIAVLLFGAGGYVATVWVCGGLFLLLALLTGISSFITYSTSEFGITNKRVLVEVGFISRNSLEVLLSKVEGIEVTQGILGRILGFGSIVVSGTGGKKVPFDNILAPLEFRRKAQEQIAAVQETR